MARSIGSRLITTNQTYKLATIHFWILTVYKKSTSPATTDLLKNLDEHNKDKPDMGQKELVTTSNDSKYEVSSQDTDQINNKKDKDIDQESPSNDVESVLERQKRIEEENKKKKAAIAKALEDR